MVTHPKGTSVRKHNSMCIHTCVWVYTPPIAVAAPAPQLPMPNFYGISTLPTITLALSSDFQRKVDTEELLSELPSSLPYLPSGNLSCASTVSSIFNMEPQSRTVFLKLNRLFLQLKEKVKAAIKWMIRAFHTEKTCELLSSYQEENECLHCPNTHWDHCGKCNQSGLPQRNLANCSEKWNKGGWGGMPVGRLACQTALCGMKRRNPISESHKGSQKSPSCCSYIDLQWEYSSPTFQASNTCRQNPYLLVPITFVISQVLLEISESYMGSWSNPLI